MKLRRGKNINRDMLFEPSLKLDLSKMPKKPISAPFVFPKSTEQQLAEALAEIEKLKAENQLYKSIEMKLHDALAEIEELKVDKKTLQLSCERIEDRMEDLKDSYLTAEETIVKLRKRIHNY